MEHCIYVSPSASDVPAPVITTSLPLHWQKESHSLLIVMLLLMEKNQELIPCVFLGGLLLVVC